MHRSEANDHFMCPRCGRTAEQRWLMRHGAAAYVRWSTCQSCYQVAIWRGASIVYPPAKRSTLARDVTALLRVLRNDVAASRRLLRLWSAIRIHLAEQERVPSERE